MNITPYETRVALLENGRVVEFFVERERERGLVGNIYMGRVQRVLPGMQAAFINIGFGKSAFLYVGDALPADPPRDEIDADGDSILPPEDEAPTFEAGVGSELRVSGARHGRKKRKPIKKIEEILQVGQKILVQISKDPIGTKGPRVTCNISVPGRYSVLMPAYPHVGISRKIVDEIERERLKVLFTSLMHKSDGFVARTIAQNMSDEALGADVKVLQALWKKVQDRYLAAKEPRLVLAELDVVLKCARDRVKDNLEKIIIDNKASYDRVCEFLAMFDVNLVQRVQHYSEAAPLFEKFQIDTEIDRAMSRKVWLRSGGYLVIDQAEALTAIDVNTGKFVGRRNLDETILKTNLEAVSEVAYQLRLRNIGGMVIVDFIDMDHEGDRTRVLGALVEALKKDKARCNVIKISELGLVEMTRQRNRESLERHLCEPCFYCDGKGTLKSRRTITYDIFRVISEKAAQFSKPNLVIQCHPEVADMLQGEERDMLKQLSDTAAKQIVIRPRGSFHQEQFDVFGATKV